MNPAYERVYHYHVRKTAGTSLNSAFWALAGLDLKTMSNFSEITRNGLKFVRSDRKSIAGGDYFFANSHAPAHSLQIPPKTCTVTILRDPAARVVAFYRYLLWAKANPLARDTEPAIDRLQVLTAGLDGSFQSFLVRIPPRLLLAQISMFSKHMDPVEAADKALTCTAICFTETFSEDLKELASTLGLDLREKHERRFGEEVSLPREELSLLQELLAPEYAMIERVREGLQGRP